MDAQVKRFFLQYERANSSSELSEIGSLYAETFMFGGPQGVQAVKKEDFLKVIPRMKAQFTALGLVETKLNSVEASAIDSKYLLAKVGWVMTVETASGIRHLDALATYVLARGDNDELSIVFQIDHQSLANAIKELQEAAQ